MELTREEAIKKHRELWYKISEMCRVYQRVVSKQVALKALGYEPDEVLNGCWCCQYAENRQSEYIREEMVTFSQKVINACNYCPIDWSPCCNDYKDLYCQRSLYYIYNQLINSVDDRNVKMAIIIALHIAELPEKDI